jgi:hypothetical protein
VFIDGDHSVSHLADADGGGGGTVVLDHWFYRSAVEASRRGLKVTGGLFGLGPTRWIDASAIEKIEARGALPRGYYDLVIVCRDRGFVAGKRLPGIRLATVVLGQIEEALGKTPCTAT